MAALLALAVKGAAVFGLGWAAAALLGRSSASLRHCAWAVTFAAALAVPALDGLGPAWGVAVLPAPEPTTATLGPLVDPSVAVETVSAGTEGGGPLGLTALLGGLWLVGGSFVGARWLRGYAVARRVVRAARPVDDAAWADRLRAAAREVGLAGPVRLKLSAEVAVPVAWGWGPPTVVLPRQSEDWSEDRARAVLTHELAHLRRRDAWVQVLAQVALVVHWPNPLAWASYRRLRDAREQACDDAALRGGTPPPAYAAHLVGVARALRPSRPTPTALAAMVATDELETRVRAVLDGGRRRGPVGRWVTAASLALAVAVGGPLAAFQPVTGQRPSEAPRPLATALTVPALSTTPPASPKTTPEHADATPPPEDRVSSAYTDGGGTRRDTTDTDLARVRREAAVAQREATAVERDAAAVEREAARVERDAAHVRRQRHAAEREAGRVQREADRVQRDAAAVEREVDHVERTLAAVKQDAATAQREAAAVEREAAAVEREAARVLRDAAQILRESRPARDSTRSE